MTTRTSKIARLPKHIREQLNQRLENGEIGRTILPWLNGLPETKRVLAELFHAKPVTHQNLSEWRRAGYQDWLFHQQRLQWFDRLTEQETEIEKNECGDAYETMGWHFLYEIGQALAQLQNIKNTDRRLARLQTLTHEFARLQNAYNWSRSVHLEWDKYNDKRPSPQPPTPQLEEDEIEEQDGDNIEEAEIGETADDNKFESAPQSDGSLGIGSEGTIENSPAVHCRVNDPTPQVPEGRLKEPSINSITETVQSAQIASQAGTTSPSPIGWERAGVRAEFQVESGAPEPNALALENANLKTAFQPLPPPAPTTPSYPTPNPQPPRARLSPVPIRGRRFTCVEG